MYKILTNIPASLSDFNEKGQLTHAKLRVFHKGLTTDGRRFTEEFANKLSQNIGGTPIVAKYNEEEDDFEGHADVQAVFGFVPENPSVSFEEDDSGNNWLITDVRLFTKRSDVGTIAQKIIGKSQSLELDPPTVKYMFKVDKDGQIEETVFTDGELIGLSVLGDNQRPAFGGSGFFSSLLSREEEIEKVITKYLSISEKEANNGGESVDKILFENSNYKVILLEDGEVVVEYATDGNTIRKKIEEDVVVPVPVDPEPELDPEPETEPDSGLEPEPETEPEGDDVEPVAEPEAAEVPEGDGSGESFNDPEEEEEGLEPEAEENASYESSLDAEERQELENYRRATKLQVVENFRGMLPEDVLKEYIDGVDSYSVNEIESELSIKAIRALKGSKDVEVTHPAASSVYTIPARPRERAEDEVDDMKSFLSSKLQK